MQTNLTDDEEKMVEENLALLAKVVQQSYYGQDILGSMETTSIRIINEKTAVRSELDAETSSYTISSIPNVFEKGKVRSKGGGSRSQECGRDSYAVPSRSSCASSNRQGNGNQVNSCRCKRHNGDASGAQKCKKFNRSSFAGTFRLERTSHSCNCCRRNKRPDAGCKEAHQGANSTCQSSGVSSAANRYADILCPCNRCKAEREMKKILEREMAENPFLGDGFGMDTDNLLARVPNLKFTSINSRLTPNGPCGPKSRPSQPGGGAQKVCKCVKCKSKSNLNPQYVPIQGKPCCSQGKSQSLPSNGQKSNPCGSFQLQSCPEQGQSPMRKDGSCSSRETGFAQNAVQQGLDNQFCGPQNSQQFEGSATQAYSSYGLPEPQRQSSQSGSLQDECCSQRSSVLRSGSSQDECYSQPASVVQCGSSQSQPQGLRSHSSTSDGTCCQPCGGDGQERLSNGQENQSATTCAQLCNSQEGLSSEENELTVCGQLNQSTISQNSTSLGPMSRLCDTPRRQASNDSTEALCPCMKCQKKRGEAHNTSSSNDGACPSLEDNPRCGDESRSALSVQNSPRQSEAVCLCPNSGRAQSKSNEAAFFQGPMGELDDDPNQAASNDQSKTMCQCTKCKNKRGELKTSSVDDGPFPNLEDNPRCYVNSVISMQKVQSTEKPAVLAQPTQAPHQSKSNCPKCPPCNQKPDAPAPAEKSIMPDDQSNLSAFCFWSNHSFSSETKRRCQCTKCKKKRGEMDTSSTDDGPYPNLEKNPRCYVGSNSLTSERSFVESNRPFGCFDEVPQTIEWPCFDAFSKPPDKVCCCEPDSDVVDTDYLSLYKRSCDIETLKAERESMVRDGLERIRFKCCKKQKGIPPQVLPVNSQSDCLALTVKTGPDIRQMIQQAQEEKPFRPCTCKVCDRKEDDFETDSLSFEVRKCKLLIEGDEEGEEEEQPEYEDEENPFADCDTEYLSLEQRTCDICIRQVEMYSRSKTSITSTGSEATLKEAEMAGVFAAELSETEGGNENEYEGEAEAESEEAVMTPVGSESGEAVPTLEEGEPPEQDSIPVEDQSNVETASSASLSAEVSEAEGNNSIPPETESEQNPTGEENEEQDETK